MEDLYKEEKEFTLKRTNDYDFSKLNIKPKKKNKLENILNTSAECKKILSENKKDLFLYPGIILGAYLLVGGINYLNNSYLNNIQDNKSIEKPSFVYNEKQEKEILLNFSNRNRTRNDMVNALNFYKDSNEFKTCKKNSTNKTNLDKINNCLIDTIGNRWNYYFGGE